MSGQSATAPIPGEWIKGCRRWFRHLSRHSLLTLGSLDREDFEFYSRCCDSFWKVRFKLMKLEEVEYLLGVAKPLVFVSAKTSEPWFGGTCFRVRHKGHLFVVTARHCIDGRVDIGKDQIHCGGLENEYLPLVSWHLICTRTSDDTDGGDMAFFEIGSDLMTKEELNRVVALDTDRHCWSHSLLPKQSLVVEGYPSTLQEMDYSSRRLLRRSQKLRAVYLGQSEFKGVARINFPDISSNSDLDGFSGGPVWAIQQLEPDCYQVGFVGMMIRASYFITAEWVIAALTDAASACVQKDKADGIRPLR